MILATLELVAYKHKLCMENPNEMQASLLKILFKIACTYRHVGDGCLFHLFVFFKKKIKKL